MLSLITSRLKRHKRGAVMPSTVTEALSLIMDNAPKTVLYIRAETDADGEQEWHILIRHLPLQGRNVNAIQIHGKGSTLDEAMDDFWQAKNNPQEILEADGIHHRSH